MHFERLTSCYGNLYMEAMGLYSESFPPHEQRKAASQKEIMHNEEYHFDLIFDGDVFIGNILYWETQNFIYVEHFCIKSEMRNMGYGHDALMLLNEKGKTVILEIDPLTDEISRRRKGFYERAGYMENGFEHIHPPYHEEYEGHHLVVMSYPHVLSDAQYNEFNDYLGKTVMGL